MLFDSHMAVLLDAAVSLVNVLTDGEARGKPFTAPRGSDLPAAVDAALPAPIVGPRIIDLPQAAHLARTAIELRRVFEAVGGARLDDAAAALNVLLLANGARPQLDRVEGEPWQVHFHGTDDSLAVGWSAGCATGLAMVIGGGSSGRLGVCQATQCDRVYVDTSRNAARQFCSTACQNRAKTAAFRARRAAAS
ncbi:CGNR zinc finger domain-containing protein [Streptacidiphilus sp. PAMC 29251]